MSTIPSIYAKDDVEALIQRINSLSPDAQRQWGTMNAGQMMKHCRIPLENLVGEPFTGKRKLLYVLLGPMIKKTIVSEKPFSQNSPTGPGMKITEDVDLNAERQRVIQMLRTIQTGGASRLEGRKHPICGPLTSTEWSISQMKHFDHHLRQFGV